ERASFVNVQSRAPFLDRWALLHQLQELGAIALVHVVHAIASEPFAEGGDIALALGPVGGGHLHGPAAAFEQALADCHPITPHLGLRLLHPRPGGLHGAADLVELFCAAISYCRRASRRAARPLGASARGHSEPWRNRSRPSPPARERWPDRRP